MKHRVARTLKWNTIDRVTTQVLYAVTGIILARVLSQEDFGLVGAVMVFQSFATLFIDSGFSNALLQRKNPTNLDYSTVLWFNLGMAGALYLILFICAPWIAWCFKGDVRLIPLSRVMFLSFIVNASAIVQTNILVKRMDVKMVAISNTIGMIASGVVGVWLALAGYGAWAIVWQTLTLGGVKSLILWLHGTWRPLMQFSWPVLRSFFGVGFGVMGSAWLNVIFQNINSLLIGNRNGMVSLGYYTQADKWSKMGIASLSQILNVSFIPVLSEYQDMPEKFAASTAKMNRLTAYLLFPCVGFLIVMAPAVFHVLFGTKWDPSISLFQLLLIRGIFVVLQAVYNNYLLARGKSKLMVVTEAVRDITALVAIVITLPYIGLTMGDNITYGLEIFMWGQVIAAALAWMVTMVYAARHAWRHWTEFVRDLVPYVALTMIIMVPMWLLGRVISNAWLLLAVQGCVALVLYIGTNALLGSKIQKDALDYLLKRSK